MRRRWDFPDDIPRAKRMQIPGGYGSFFCTHHLGNEPVQCTVRQHALLIPTDWFEIVIRGREVILPPGSAMIAGYETIKIFGPGELHAFHFGPEIVRKAIGGDCLLDAMMLSAPDYELIPEPVPRIFPWIKHRFGEARYHENLTSILRMLVHDIPSATMWVHFRRTYFLPRLKMRLALERAVFQPRENTDQYAREFRRLNGIEAGDWVEKRKAQVANIWLRHGTKDVEEIAEAVHLTEREFRGMYQRRYGYSPYEVVRSRDCDRISPDLLARIIRPSWAHGSPVAEPITFPCVDDSFNEIHGIVESPAPSQRIIPEAVISSFWNMKSTGIGDIIKIPECLRDAIAA